MEARRGFRGSRRKLKVCTEADGSFHGIVEACMEAGEDSMEISMEACMESSVEIRPICMEAAQGIRY